MLSHQDQFRAAARQHHAQCDCCHDDEGYAAAVDALIDSPSFRAEFYSNFPERIDAAIQAGGDIAGAVAKLVREAAESAADEVSPGLGETQRQAYRRYVGLFQADDVKVAA